MSDVAMIFLLSLVPNKLIIDSKFSYMFNGIRIDGFIPIVDNMFHNNPEMTMF